jgi:hypothetical protein
MDYQSKSGENATPQTTKAYFIRFIQKIGSVFARNCPASRNHPPGDELFVLRCQQPDVHTFVPGVPYTFLYNPDEDDPQVNLIVCPPSEVAPVLDTKGPNTNPYLTVTLRPNPNNNKFAYAVFEGLPVGWASAPPSFRIFKDTVSHAVGNTVLLRLNSNRSREGSLFPIPVATRPLRTHAEGRANISDRPPEKFFHWVAKEFNAGLLLGTEEHPKVPTITYDDILNSRVELSSIEDQKGLFDYITEILTHKYRAPGKKVNEDMEDEKSKESVDYETKLTKAQRFINDNEIGTAKCLLIWTGRDDCLSLHTAKTVSKLFGLPSKIVTPSNAISTFLPDSSAADLNTETFTSKECSKVTFISGNVAVFNRNKKGTESCTGNKNIRAFMVAEICPPVLEPGQSPLSSPSSSPAPTRRPTTSKTSPTTPTPQHNARSTPPLSSGLSPRTSTFSSKFSKPTKLPSTTLSSRQPWSATGRTS